MTIFLKPLFVLIGLLIVAKLVTPIIAALALGIFLIMIMDLFSPGAYPSNPSSYDDDDE
jgi:hypothetical protein